jgi:hypothetical protein
MNFEKYCEEYQFPEKLRKIMDKRQTHTQNNTPQFGADLKARLKDVKSILEIDTELAPGLGFIHTVRLDPTPDGIAGILIHPKNGLMPPGTDERAYAEYLLEAECLVRQQLT